MQLISSVKYAWTLSGCDVTNIVAQLWIGELHMEYESELESSLNVL